MRIHLSCKVLLLPLPADRGWSDQRARGSHQQPAVRVSADRRQSGRWIWGSLSSRSGIHFHQQTLRRQAQVEAQFIDHFIAPTASSEAHQIMAVITRKLSSKAACWMPSAFPSTSRTSARPSEDHNLPETPPGGRAVSGRSAPVEREALGVEAPAPMLSAEKT